MKINVRHSIEQCTVDASIDQWHSRLKTRIYTTYTIYTKTQHFKHMPFGARGSGNYASPCRSSWWAHTSAGEKKFHLRNSWMWAVIHFTIRIKCLLLGVNPYLTQGSHTSWKSTTHLMLFSERLPIICVMHGDLWWKNQTTHYSRFWRAGCSRLEYLDIHSVY